MNAPFDRITSPHFARELHAVTQGFTALVAGFAVTAWIVAEPHIGPFLCILGIVAVVPAWVIATLTFRMALEIGLVILSIHHEITHPATREHTRNLFPEIGSTGSREIEK
ncbi:hypothetical protein [Actinomadura harenae]|uniref:DUF4282 domain-containing protein n=1 Tax=Actinomadura harenae TaxID=2483351 RepID=A0A3M2LR76_9ACTN|nr:hypothetical protein [Actinomadura harenae]RMI39053.1 hypothetical protein EBO15_30790 [Actinomadura harenae]